MINLIKKLWPINRSLTGEGNRKTLKILKKFCNSLKIKEVKSGKKVFDWEIPLEWNVKEAWIKNIKNKKIVDFKKNNLHLVGYSMPVKKKILLSELKKKIFSLKKQPNAIPYVTSYYKKDWGFCMPYNLKKKLNDKFYKVLINSSFKRGSLSYGEIIIKGKSRKEIFFSTYICHPSMANNELSGPCIAISLAQWLKAQKNLNYTYRIIFVPETIGAISYINKNLTKLKKNVFAGFNLTCLGDERCYSYLPSRNGKTFSDHLAKHVLYYTDKNYKKYTWLDRGSDERQYCAPGIDLPIATIMRSKYGTYPEYHTSLDKIGTVVTEMGLKQSFNIFKKIIFIIENNFKPNMNIMCEPMLSKRNLYPTFSEKNTNKNSRNILNFLSFCDAKHTLLEISEKISLEFEKVYNYYLIFKKNKIIN
jgi:aminopeptidase-like protein